MKKYSTNIMNTWVDNRTNAQMAVYRAAKMDVEDPSGLLATLISRRDAARLAANVTLPMTNEAGNPVVHGARQRASALADMYQTMIREMSWLVNEDTTS